MLWFSQDVILGKIYFLLVRIKIKFMELAVIRREAAGKCIISSSLLTLVSLTHSLASQAWARAATTRART